IDDPSAGHPRAARNRWKLAKVRDASELSERAPWLRLSPDDVAACRAGDDSFDALIAALVARAHVLGECEPVPADEVEAARREGGSRCPAKESRTPRRHRVTKGASAVLWRHVPLQQADRDGHGR